MVAVSATSVETMPEPHEDGQQADRRRQLLASILHRAFESCHVAWQSLEAQHVTRWLMGLIVEEGLIPPEEWERKIPRLVDLGLVLYRVGTKWEKEEEWVVTGWLAKSMCNDQTPPPAAWEAQLEGALQIGTEIYREFGAQFDSFFSGAASPGYRRVERQIHARLPEISDTDLEDQTSKVIDRIWAKRQHLLDSVYRRYQVTLFGPKLFQSHRLPGFFTRVADMESRNLPPLLGRAVSFSDHIRPPKDDDLPDRLAVDAAAAPWDGRLAQETIP